MSNTPTLETLEMGLLCYVETEPSGSKLLVLAERFAATDRWQEVDHIRLSEEDSGRTVRELVDRYLVVRLEEVD